MTAGLVEKPDGRSYYRTANPVFAGLAHTLAVDQLPAALIYVPGETL
ncbi:MAG: hypothetical protein VB858_13685 [Planctomycetaceae bacterium]